MRRITGIAMLLAAGVLTALPRTAAAGGLFWKKQCECGQDSEDKKSKLFSVAAAPRAATVTAVPAVLTTDRADRLPAPAAAPAPKPVPAAPPACTPPAPTGSTDPRIDELHRDVQILKQQIQVLSTLLANQPRE